MKRTWTAVVAATVLTFVLLPSRSVQADSGAIQLQRLPNLLLEGEGVDAVPPGVDSNLVASSGIITNGFGRILMTKHKGVQTFFVEARNLPVPPNAFNFAYGVFLADFPGSTNFQQIGVLNLISHNPKHGKSHWALRYSQVGGAPPQLGVEELADLDGREVRIITSPLAIDSDIVALHAVLPPVLPDPKVLSAHANIAMSVPPTGPGTPPSPDATGTLTLLFDGRNGRSLLAIHANGLAKGTGFIVFLENAPGADQYTEVDELNEPADFPNGLAGGSLVLDTKRGDALDFFASTPADLAGRRILVVDPFFDAFNPSLSSVHLMTVIPAFPGSPD
jgi:hypothetical protein